VPLLKPLYSYAWFVGFFASGALYWALSVTQEPVEAAAQG
jgi:cytosine/uracil/thiamine/allantoin permease